MHWGWWFVSEKASFYKTFFLRGDHAMKTTLLFCILGLSWCAGCNPASTVESPSTIGTQSETPIVAPVQSSTATHASTPPITVAPTATGTNTPTPTPLMPGLGDAITSETAGQVALLKTWGKGIPDRMQWIKDGSLLVVQTGIGAYVYDPCDWEEVASWDGVRELAFSKNDSILALGFGRGRVTLWNYRADVRKEIDQGYDPESARRWAQPSNPWDPIADEINGRRTVADALALSDDGRVLAIAGRDSQVGIWNAEEGMLIGKMTSKAAPPASRAAFSPGADLLVTDGRSPNLVVWDLEKQNAVIRASTMTGNFSDSPFSPDGTLLITFNKNLVYVWDVSTQARRARLWTDLEDWIWDAVFSGDGEYIIINNYERILRASDGLAMPLDTLAKPEEKPLPDRSSLASKGFMSGRITGVALGRDGNPLAWGYGGWAGPQWFWRIAENRFEPPDWSHCENLHAGYTFYIKVETPRGEESRLQVVSPDCSLRAEVNGGSIQVFRMSDGTLLHGLSGHSGQISVLVFSPGGKYFASGASQRLAGNELILWRADPAVGLWKTNSGEGYVGEISFSRDETAMAVSSDQIRLWRTADQWLLGSINGSTGSMTFSPDGKILAVASADASITLYLVQNLEQLAVIPGSPGSYVSITGLAFTPDGAGLLGGLSDGTVRLWGVSSGAE
jgi:WD40 repeat protein